MFVQMVCMNPVWLSRSTRQYRVAVAYCCHVDSVSCLRAAAEDIIQLWSRCLLRSV